MLVLDARSASRALCGVAVLAVLTAGCAAADPSAGAAGAPDALVADTGAAAPAAAADAAPPADPDAPPTYRPVKRPGKGAPSVKGGPGTLAAAGAPVRYPDGVSVAVERIARATEQGEGTGAFPGRPLTAVTFRLTNGSASAVDLSQVVVTTAYGVKPKLAAPVYTEAAQDFTGEVAPGGTTQATYVFALPPGQAKKVAAWVDFDAVHTAASFTGDVL